MIDAFLNWIGVILGLYIMFEAVDDVGRYSGPDRICLVSRDVSTGLAGLMLTWYAALHKLDGLHLALAVPLALYLWPKMVIRYRHFRGLVS
jgi:hypothetical protein